ncbi:hypothetical protein AHiyo6_08800 [Arthrobacter sp. Hiyo6]|nr:hypothetical protein AHiyo6_08800 [Arthrobacter sp. Hiyo6]
MWLFVAAVLKLMPSTEVSDEDEGISAVTGMMKEMFDRVVGAAPLPGMFVLIQTIVAVSVRTQMY